ncbi:MAG: hypothetical protein HY881_03705 [Deltaproteobacteria bacterium]|nr:hypothetical protein [Deltaproteobacteria bacterium]
MTMWNNKAFTENEFSPFGKAVVIILLVVSTVYISIHNIIKGSVANPYAFTICLLGFLLFLISKVSQFSKRALVGFGTSHLTENTANFYSIGYWLMAVGLILTFF